MSGSNSNYPLDSVVYITDTIDGSEWQGSGVLIAPNEVLTAAHVVYNSEYGQASDISVTPDYSSGTAPFGTAIGTSVHYNPVQDANDLITLQQSQSDFAVIHLNTAFDDIGTMALEANFSGGSVDVAGYPGSSDGALVNQPETVTVNPFYTILDGTNIGPGSSGGPVWVTSANGTADEVGLVSSGVTDGAGYFVQLTAADVSQIDSWVESDDGINIAAPLAVGDTTTGTALPAASQLYTGPVEDLLNQYINVTSDNLNIAAATPGWFLHSGSGTDALSVTSGTNVLDGGTGSNFLTGGSGTDTFFVDDRGALADIWSTINNFHSGDSATIWGVTPSTFNFAWVDGQGATGYTGLTLHATAPGEATASVTLTGYTEADLSDGRLSISYGTDPASGSIYTYVHAA